MMRKLLLFSALASLSNALLDAGLPGPVAKLTAAEIARKERRRSWRLGRLAQCANTFDIRKNGRGGKPPVRTAHSSYHRTPSRAARTD